MAKAEEAKDDIPEIVDTGEKCLSCKMSISNDQGAVNFKCPDCGKYEIIRCSKCRKTVSKYKCPNCGFEGPN